MEKIVIRSHFKCGHTELEFADSLQEARHLQTSAAYYKCVNCYVQEFFSRKEVTEAICHQQQPAAKSA